MSEAMNNEMGQMGAPSTGEAEPSPGAVLAARREELRLSIEQAASQLNLAPRQIQAIEGNNYAALPGLASTRGFIRSYARLLKIDPEPLLARIAKEASPVEETIPLRRPLPSRPFVETRLSDARAFPVKRGVLWAVVIVAVAAVGAVIIGGRSGWSSLSLASLEQPRAKPSTDAVNPPRSTEASRNRSDASSSAPPAAGVVSGDATAASATNSGSTSASAADQSGAASATTQTFALSAPGGAETKTDKGAVAEATTPDPAKAPIAGPTTQNHPAADTAAASGQPSGGPTAAGLSIALTEDSWIQVKQADGKVVASRVFKSGTSETVPVSGPVSVVVGNVKGVKLTYKGQPVDLAHAAKDNVARLTLK